VTTDTTTGADLLRALGLLADGPARWGRPIAGRGPGIYVVELAAPAPGAPLDLALVGRWLERVPGLRLDGAETTSKALAARLAALWWPEARILYVGASTASIGARVAALVAHAPGDRRPHPDGQWLHLLRGLAALRIWWASTEATEEYLDGLLDAFAQATGPALPDRPAGALPLPWANTRRPTGERQATGLTGSVAPAEPQPPKPGTRVVDLPAGDAEGARDLVERPVQAHRSVPPARRAPGPSAVTLAKTRRPPRPSTPPPSTRPEPVHLTAEALDRTRLELDELTRVKRPEVVARIKSARELGDLRENADYHAAREEQSFLEGRILALEDRLRRAVVVDEATGQRVVLGSSVTVEHEGETLAYTIVGSAEADPAAGRISMVSPVGAALMGARTGDRVTVRTPRGAAEYVVRSIG
jgi:transcription elongation factor GreA